MGTSTSRAPAKDLHLIRYLCRAALAVSLTWPCVAPAQMALSPYGSLRYEYDSNIFAVSPGDPLLVSQGDPQRADSIRTLTGGINFNDAWGLQKLKVNLEGREANYAHYTRLNHSEYLGDVALTWVLVSGIDGNLDIRRDHSQALFQQRETTQLEIDTNQDLVAGVNIKIANDFRLEGGYTYHDAQTPLTGDRSAGLLENTARVAFRYVGQANLSYGLEASQLNGRFRNSFAPSTYNQDNADFVFGYALGSFSKLNGSIGYSDRKDNGTHTSNAGLTGSIGFFRQLTGKTSLNGEVRRAINSFVVGGGSETDTSGTLGATWAATGRISVIVSVSQTHSAYGQQAASDPVDSGRSDQFSTVNFGLTYQMLRWLSLRPYARYETRHSSRSQFTYDNSIIGVELRGQY